MVYKGYWQIYMLISMLVGIVIHSYPCVFSKHKFCYILFPFMSHIELLVYTHFCSLCCLLIPQQLFGNVSVVDWGCCKEDVHILQSFYSVLRWHTRKHFGGMKYCATVVKCCFYDHILVERTSYWRVLYYISLWKIDFPMKKLYY